MEEGVGRYTHHSVLELSPSLHAVLPPQFRDVSSKMFVAVARESPLKNASTRRRFESGVSVGVELLR
jgi:hypothetical protein